MKKLLFILLLLFYNFSVLAYSGTDNQIRQNFREFCEKDPPPGMSQKDSKKFCRCLANQLKAYGPSLEEALDYCQQKTGLKI
jgi:hypothetical protein